ncbi:MAG: hypothetical protein RIQ60_2099 [Pseudomonadota bacterium]|jgi:uncharacterized protein (DUF58 family)
MATRRFAAGSGTQAPAQTMPPGARPTPEQLLQRLEWTVLKRLDGQLQGDYRSLWRGAGLDLADLREYQHGDDVRHIDWNVTARLQLPHVRQFHEDREVAAWLLVDLSASLDVAGASERGKLALAEELVAAMSRLLGRHGNPVGAIFYRPGAPSSRGAAGATVVVPPRTGRTQALQLVSRLRQLTDHPVAAAAPAVRRAGWLERLLRGRDADAKAGGAAMPEAVAGTWQAQSATRLADLLHVADGVIRRRSIVLLVSDFISLPGWVDGLGRLARRHDVLAVRLNDAIDHALPELGLLTLQDAETGEQVLVDTGDPGLQRRFAALAEREEAELLAALARAGVDTLELTTQEDLLAALLRFVVLRRQRLKAGGSLANRAAATDAAAAAARAGEASVPPTAAPGGGSSAPSRPLA